jgi:hypothetical protein
MDGPEKLATRHVLQTLAAHKALALLRMYHIDPSLIPHGVEEAIRELEIATEPLRVVPIRRSKEERDADHAAKVERRMAAGMTREMAEVHAASGSRLGPDGEDLDAGT